MPRTEKPGDKRAPDKPNTCSTVLLFVTHSKRVLSIARRYGWLPGARCTNLRDVRNIDRVGFIDIEWQRYAFDRHLEIVKDVRPLMTVAQDIEKRSNLKRILAQAEQLALYSTYVVIVPKDPALAGKLNQIPSNFILGYSVPTKYGGTRIPPSSFKRPVHLLGGRPDVQRRLADQMPVFSVDCNRFTLDAAFGDYFDGTGFRRHPKGGYERCLRESIRNITRLWHSYQPRSLSNAR
jgi:hypothetical protein